MRPLSGAGYYKQMKISMWPKYISKASFTHTPCVSTKSKIYHNVQHFWGRNNPHTDMDKAGMTL